MADPKPEDLAAAADQIAAAPAPASAPPPEAEVAARLKAQQSASPAGVTEVDPAQLFAMIQALQQRIDTMEEERAAGEAPPLLSTAQTVKDLLSVHAAHNPAVDHTAVLALTDDLVDAAGNALDSGDGSELRKIGTRLERAIGKIHPGPGDHHYLNQALGFVRDHLPEAVDELRPRPAKEPAAAVGTDRAPVKVVQGSVTG